MNWNPIKWFKKPVPATEPVMQKVMLIDTWLGRHAGHKSVTFGPAPYAAFRCDQCNDELLVKQDVLDSIRAKAGTAPTAQVSPNSAANIPLTDATDGKAHSDHQPTINCEHEWVRGTGCTRCIKCGYIALDNETIVTCKE